MYKLEQLCQSALYYVYSFAREILSLSVQMLLHLHEPGNICVLYLSILFFSVNVLNRIDKTITIPYCHAKQSMLVTTTEIALAIL